MSEATMEDYAVPVTEGRPAYPGGLEYDPDQKRVSVRFLRPYSRRGRLYKVDEIVHNVPLSVAQELRNHPRGPIVEPYKAPVAAQEELRPAPIKYSTPEESGSE